MFSVFQQSTSRLGKMVHAVIAMLLRKGGTRGDKASQMFINAGNPLISHGRSNHAAGKLVYSPDVNRTERVDPSSWGMRIYSLWDCGSFSWRPGLPLEAFVKLLPRTPIIPRVVLFQHVFRLRILGNMICEEGN
jgi:hypothetical protein